MKNILILYLSLIVIKKIDTLIHSNDDYGFRGVNNLIYVSNKFYGDFLTKQMDTMSSAIKF